ncbi:MAG: ribokinase, partial [Candidatus Rokubacteria bacterium]|nr:ribokinase [Candidatus Rokubacteria bacterium]
MPRVLIVGSANVDLTVAAPRLPRPGETVSDGTLYTSHGGKGANQAVAARRLGADVRLIACVGDDAAGRAIRAALAAEAIGVEGVVATGEAATGTALIVVDAEGRNQIAVAPGANRRLTVAMVEARREDFAWAEVVACQLETPLDTVAWALAEARRRGAATVLNPAPVDEGALVHLPLVDYLTPNEGEAERLSGVAAADAAG